MNVSDIPDEVKNWIMKQKEPFTIFYDEFSTLTLVSGTHLPSNLWYSYRRGLIQEWLQSDEAKSLRFDDYNESFLIRTEEPIYNTAQIAALLGVSKRSVYHFVKSLSMPHFWVGKKLRFRLDEVVSWYVVISREVKRRGLNSNDSSRLADSNGETDT